MKLRLLLCAVTLTALQNSIFAQINARMFRYPDVSESHITFSYAGDVWIVEKTGGTAIRLSSPDGEEMFPKFSPDGKTIAYMASYDGNNDIYTIPVTGGVPKRLTYHSSFDVLVDWHPDGKSVLYSSGRESERQRYRQFHKVSIEGGPSEKLPLPYADFGSYSPDGSKVAFNFHSRTFRTWKRYQGGSTPSIYIFDLNSSTSEKVTENRASDEYPMWIGNKIYYLSDQGPNKRYNIWVYDISAKSNTQLTNFKDEDIHFPSAGKDDIVFEAGGKLYLLDVGSGEYNEVVINVITDQSGILPRMVKTDDLIFSASISHDAKRVAMIARGEVYTVPTEDGFVKNLSNTSGSAERYAAWSPDGKTIAYWTDKQGEYQLALYDVAAEKESIVTSFSDGFRYNIYWSPDSKKLAFVDQTMDINYFDVGTKSVTKIDKGLSMLEWGLRNFQVSWSPDSRWIAYSRSLKNNNSAIFIYDTSIKKRYQVTAGYYSDRRPQFDVEGKYLYLVTSRNFSPDYSDVDGTFIYSNTSQVAAISLKSSTPSILEPKNDAVEAKKEDTNEADDKKKKKSKEDDEDAEDEIKVDIDLANMERRMVIIEEIKPGNYRSLASVKGKLIYHKGPNTGSEIEKAPLMYYDLEKRETKTIVGDADGFELAAGGEKILIGHNNNYAIVEVGADQKMDKTIKTDQLKMMLDPKAEWKQIFTDAWRFERDFFYDKNMHGVNWNGMRIQYGNLLNDAVTRWDVNFVLGELIGELNASHTYRGGGDQERAKNENMGYLGVDWELTNGFYRIKKIIRGAQWDTEVRSPLDMPGVEVKVGNYILAVNGIPLDPTKEPFAAFEGLGGETVELTYNSSPSKSGAKKVIVQTLNSETRLRHLAWIEANRKRVEEATNGRCGYAYVRSTGLDGQSELVRQFVAQVDKDAIIVDERFNSGGQIPDRFIELLNRKPLAYWAVRDGKDWKWPHTAIYGPKAMLINGWSGSGGDAFPDYFRKAELGPLIGSRTWGGLIGISGAPTLIDGGGVTVPTFRMYDPDGKWFKEGHGVDPDIPVPENPGELATGTDAQLERAIQYINEQLKTYKGKPDHEEYEVR